MSIWTLTVGDTWQLIGNWKRFLHIFSIPTLVCSVQSIFCLVSATPLFVLNMFIIIKVVEICLFYEVFVCMCYVTLAYFVTRIAQRKKTCILTDIFLEEIHPPFSIFLSPSKYHTPCLYYCFKEKNGGYH